MIIEKKAKAKKLMSQKKYPRPKLRGEKWILWNDKEAIVLRHLAKDCIEVLNERGGLEAVYEAQFRKRLEPLVEEK